MTPRPGTLPYLRAWQGDGFRRGAQVTVAGERARITSAAGQRVAVRFWSSGQRALVLPHEVDFDPETRAAGATPSRPLPRVTTGAVPPCLDPNPRSMRGRAPRPGQPSAA